MQLSYTFYMPLIRSKPPDSQGDSGNWILLLFVHNQARPSTPPLDRRESLPSSINFFQVKTSVINTFLQLYFIELSISHDAPLEGEKKEVGGEFATAPEKSNEIREFIAGVGRVNSFSLWRREEMEVLKRGNLLK